MIEEFAGMYEVSKKDVVECGKLFTDAFKIDPKWSKLFEGLKERQQNAFYQEPTNYCMKYGDVYATSENLEGVIAIVSEKYAEMTPFRVMMTCTLSIVRQGGFKLLRFLSNLDTTFTPLEESRDRIMKDREFLFVFVLGVRTSMQGKGHGSKLMRALCDYADRINMPIYLETATELNVRFYNKHGFTVTEKDSAPNI